MTEYEIRQAKLAMKSLVHVTNMLQEINDVLVSAGLVITAESVCALRSAASMIVHRTVYGLNEQ